MRIAVFASGNGTNFEAIVRAVDKGRIKAELALLVCDKPQAVVIARARRAGVKVALVERDNFPSKMDFEAEIIRRLKEERIGLIVLAGFMRLLSAEFVRKYKGRIINIHPSLLPAFKGTQGIEDAFGYGVKVTGVTVHFVDEQLDHGPIILQQAIEIGRKETLSSLEEKIHRLEHKLYPEAVRLFVERRLKIEGRQVKITP